MLDNPSKCCLTQIPKVEEIREQSPDLKLGEDELGIEVDIEGCDDLRAVKTFDGPGLLQAWSQAYMLLSYPPSRPTYITAFHSQVYV